MEKPVIDKYFAKKGIAVRFNTLGYDQTLIRAYLKDFQSEVDNSFRKTSQDVKHACYNKIYSVKPRPKFTGFETLKKQETALRKDIGLFITTPQFSPLLTVEHDENDRIEISFKDALVDSVKKIDNPIVYLSGGMDSEIVANAFIEAGKKFIPLIYYYVDEKGELLNKHDIGYAYAFCRKHGLFPIIKQLNLPKLWSTPEFKKLAIDIQIQSPQLVTYAYMIEQTNQEYPDHTHVFGGEVRFKSNYTYANRNYNIVFLDKLVPSYDGGSYTTTGGLIGESVFLQLVYRGNTLSNPGTWDLINYIDGQGNPIVFEQGLWTTTPALGPYELDCVGTQLYKVGTSDYYPKGDGGWITINAYDYGVAYVTAGPTPYGQAYTITASFNISVRVVGEVSPVVNSTITMTAYSEYT